MVEVRKLGFENSIQYVKKTAKEEEKVFTKFVVIKSAGWISEIIGKASF